MLVTGIIGLYFGGLILASYIKGRFFYRFDDETAFLLMALWPAVLVLALPFTIFVTTIKYIGYGMSLIVDIGEKQYFQKQAELRQRHDAVEAVRNIDMFEDDRDQDVEELS